MTKGSSKAVDRKAHARSRITNGKDLLPSVDGRSVWARLYRDVYSAMLSHVGGADYASEPKKAIARRIATLEAELIHLEDGFAQDRAGGKTPEAAALDLYSRLANGQRRMFEAVGYDRTMIDATTSLSRYIGGEAS